MSSEALPQTRLIPVTKWADYHDWPPIGGLRHLIFYSEPRVNSRGETIPGNGFDRVVKRAGRRVLIDERAFFEWVDSCNGIQPQD